MMKKGFTALKFGTWEEYKETFRKKMNASERAFDRIKEAVRRALLLPFEERADGPQGAGSVWAQHPAAWRASLLFDSEEAGICARQRGLQLFPELKGGGEASDNVQADNVSNEALYVIGLHGSGDKISLFLQDWEVAKVPLSCQKALDTLCQEKTKLKGDVVGLVFERACRLSDKPL